jgi:K+-transporting ATPase ATPase A chain
MTAAWSSTVSFVVLLLLLAWPLGLYMARVLDPQGAAKAAAAKAPQPASRGLARWVERVLGSSSSQPMSWRGYAIAVLASNAIGVVFVYAILRLQHVLPFNPEGFGAVAPDLAFNTAISFGTNTNWQAYSGESTLSYFSQMAALTTQNFLSAATGMAVLLAIARGLRGDSGPGNYWLDLVRSTLYVLVPLSVVLGLVLVAQGVPQTLGAYVDYQGLADGSAHRLPLGPAASQIAIKQLGTNGGGFFGVNSAHPLENPTPLSNLLQLLSILLIPAACCVAFGRWVRDARQGRALLAAMTIVLVAGLALTQWSEQRGTPELAAAGAELVASAEQPGGNMEGKELRFGIAASSQWAVATTAASNGSVNSMHDSLTPLGSLAPMWLMLVGEVVFGGVGSGLYGMLAYVIIAVFVAGLMIGRTPEYLGRKIEPFETKMASLAVLTPCVLVLAGVAASCLTSAGRASLQEGGAHGFSEALYAWASAGNNNGSAFGGFSANTPFYNYALGAAMWISRYCVILPMLWLAASLSQKRAAPVSLGTLQTHSALFVAFLLAVIVLVAALCFLPALALGPLAEHMQPLAG